MTALEQLTAADLRAVMAGYRDALRRHQDRINRLNVYPVPDGDTGTNMALTLESVVAELAELERDAMPEVCHAIGHGSLMGARGNSGVIICQVLRGLVGAVRDLDAVDGPSLAEGLSAASSASYEAVQKPTEGTILTVVREASEAAVERVESGDRALVAVLDAARERGASALDRTPELLPVLDEAGVVDAGGAGFLLLLDALLHVADGRAVPEPAEVTGAGAVPSAARPGRSDGDEHESDLRYEVMYLLEAPDEAIPAFKDVWAGIGDSIVVVGGDGIWNCHVHTDDIGAAVEAAIEIGLPRNIRVTDLREEVEEARWVREAAAQAGEEEDPPHEPVPCGVVAVATGDGIRRIFHSLRVQRVVGGGQSMNPSTEQLLDAVETVRAPEVVILPNNKNILAVAERVGELTDKHVRVVATRSVTEGFAALLAYDPEAAATTNVETMAGAAEAVVAAEVTRAVRDSSSELGPISEGDFLGIGPDGIRAIEKTVADAACELLHAVIADDHEIVTIIEGEGSSAADTRFITQWLEEHRPGVEPEVHHGGQPLYPYLFGIE